jgi:uncharacterized DUF497 family protein
MALAWRSHFLQLTQTTVVHALSKVKIERDPRKADENLRAHGVRFSEAATVLTGDYALTREDPDAVDEQRFVTLGFDDLY